MAIYVGILDGHGKTWGVRIPDLPGCYGAGATGEAAIADVPLRHANGLPISLAMAEKSANPGQ